MFLDQGDFVLRLLNGLPHLDADKSSQLVVVLFEVLSEVLHEGDLLFACPLDLDFEG